MSGLRLFQRKGAKGRPRINRVPSPALALGIPWASVMLASIAPGWFLIASAPVLPPHLGLRPTRHTLSTPTKPHKRPQQRPPLTRDSRATV